MDQDKGLRLASRFSSITNRLRYCGPKDAYKDFYLLLSGKKYDRKKITEHFIKYEGLYVYFKALSEKHNLDIFDYRVVEAYWLGNELLDGFSRDELRDILNGLTQRGLPKEYAETLSVKLPFNMNPHHSFNVLFVGVGKTTGSVPTNLLTMNKCSISVGKVHEITQRQLVVSVNPLVMHEELLSYGKPEIQYVEHDELFTPKLKKGDMVALHWDFACKILEDKEADNIVKYTQKNIESLNAALFFSTKPDSL
jgi:hypothetical protein